MKLKLSNDMKTFLECLDEAAAITEAHHISAYIKLSLDEIHLVMLQAAADIYSTQSNSHKPVIGGPASASVSEGEQLGNEAWEKSVSDGCECTILTRKDECKEYTGCPKYMNRV